MKDADGTSSDRMIKRAPPWVQNSMATKWVFTSCVAFCLVHSVWVNVGFAEATENGDAYGFRVPDFGRRHAMPYRRQNDRHFASRVYSYGGQHGRRTQGNHGMSQRSQGSYEGGWFQRPYPYHLDYYKMRYGGSYEPYFGNLYGPPVYVFPSSGYYGGVYYH